MKLNSLYTLALFILLASNMFSQTIVGNIIDIENNPIAYANIQIAKDGVLSNEEGEFTVELNNFKPTDSVKISYIGYKSIKFTVKDLSSKSYQLIEEINELDEITVSKQVYSLEQILDKIQGNLDVNYPNKAIKQQIFQRSTNSSKSKRFEFEILKASLLSRKARKEVNKSLEELISKSINETSKSYSENLVKLLKSEKKTKLKVLKATKLVNKDKDQSGEKLQSEIINIFAIHLENDATYKVKTGIFPIADSLKIDEDITDQFYKKERKVSDLKSMFSSKVKSFDFHKTKSFDFINKTKNYHYKLKGSLLMDGEKVYIINFSPKRSAALYKGTMFVNAYDFAIIKVAYQYAEGKQVSKNYKLLLGAKFSQSKRKVEIYYQKNTMDYYSLKFIKEETKSYIFINRSLKFTKNRKDKSEDKKMIKMEFLVETDNINKDEFFFIDESEITKTDFDIFKQAKKYKIEYISKYTPEIWKGYNVLSPVSEIKNYDTGK